MGGCSATTSVRCQSKALLYIVLDTLYRRRQVETTFRELKIVNAKLAKYPYLPVFSKSGENNGEGDSDDDSTGAADEVSKANLSYNSAAMSSTLSPKDMDDWTDSSSMLPGFVKEHRKTILGNGGSSSSGVAGQAAETANNALDATTTIAAAGGARRKSGEIRDRHMADKAILKKLAATTGVRGGGAAAAAENDAESAMTEEIGEDGQNSR